jgi:uncharacterized cofD-like protein
MDFLKWLYPGMHVKRWLALLLFGIVVTSLGFGYLLRQIYESYAFPDWVWYATLQFLPRTLRAVLFLLIGPVLAFFAFLMLNRSILQAVLPEGIGKLVNRVHQGRFLQTGPRVVAIGGGTGMPTLLRGLKEHTTNISAVVTVADDGGSSGRLRSELGVLPPGDIRNCMAALADAEPLMTKLFQYRFSKGSGLEGHSFGNLFIVAMSGVIGNFEQAVRESSRVLAVRGQILPSTLENVTLCAEMEDADTIRGEHLITESPKRIKRVFLHPEHIQANPEAIRAILEAELIVMGPGSLYTSLLPNLVVSDIARAVRASSALKVYVCNVATQPGETDEFTMADHVAAIQRHAGEDILDLVLANSNLRHDFPPEWHVSVVEPDGRPVEGADVVLADVVNDDNRLRHDPQKLAAALMRLYGERAPVQAARAEVAA